MSNSAADGAGWTRALDRVVAETAAGRLLPGVHRCLLRVERRLAGPWIAVCDHPALTVRVEDPTTMPVLRWLSTRWLMMC